MTGEEIEIMDCDSYFRYLLGVESRVVHSRIIMDGEYELSRK